MKRTLELQVVVVHIVIKIVVAFRIGEEGDKVEQLRKDQAIEDCGCSAKKSHQRTSKC